MHLDDVALRYVNRCYFIVGRMKRFLKIFGLRTSLDKVENLIKSEFKIDCYCKGNDEKLIVMVIDNSVREELPTFIEEKTHLFHQKIEVQLADANLRNEVGNVVNQ